MNRRSWYSVARLVPLAVLAPLAAGLGSVACGETPSDTDATVSIRHPRPGATVTEKQLEVRGRADGVDTVDVQGESVDVVAGKWETTVSFDEGPAEVTARAGEARARVAFTVDSVPPSLELDAPERAIYVDPGAEIAVEGTASDGGTGLRAVEVQESVVEVRDDGSFEHTLQPDSGLQVVEVKALDEAGNESTALRGAVVGETTEPAAPIEQAFDIFIRPATLETVATLAERAASPDRLTQMARGRVDTENLEIESIDHDDLAVTLTPRSGSGGSDGFVDVDIDVDNLVVEGRVGVGDDPIPVAISLEDGAVAAELIPSFDDEGALQMELQSLELQIDPDELVIAVRDESGDRSEIDRESLRESAVGIAERTFRHLLTDRLVGQLYDPDMLTRKVSLLERTFTFELKPQSIDIDGRGIIVETDVAMPGDKHRRVPEVPGALIRETDGDSGTPPESGDLELWSDRTTVDRLLHGIWRSGLLHQDLGSEAFAGYELPFELDAGALSVAVDGSITAVASPSTPARILLRPRLPLATAPPTDRAKGAVWIRAAEFELVIQLLPDNGPPTTVARLATFLDLAVSARLDDGRITPELTGRARSDLVAEPEVEFDDRQLERLVSNLMETLPELVSDRLSLGAGWEPTWLRVEEPGVTLFGPDDNRLQFTVGISPNPDWPEN